MNMSLLIGLAVLVICILLILIYVRIHRKELLLFLLRMKELTSLIEQHKSQLRIRDTYLNHYNFLKYNLKEALKVQINIKI